MVERYAWFTDRWGSDATISLLMPNASALTPTGQVLSLFGQRSQGFAEGHHMARPLSRQIRFDMVRGVGLEASVMSSSGMGSSWRVLIRRLMVYHIMPCQAVLANNGNQSLCCWAHTKAMLDAGIRWQRQQHDSILNPRGVPRLSAATAQSCSHFDAERRSQLRARGRELSPLET